MYINNHYSLFFKKMQVAAYCYLNYFMILYHQLTRDLIHQYQNLYEREVRGNLARESQKNSSFFKKKARYFDATNYAPHLTTDGNEITVPSSHWPVEF